MATVSSRAMASLEAGAISRLAISAIARSYRFNRRRRIADLTDFLLRRPKNSGALIVNLFWARVNWNLIGYFTGARTDVNFLTLGPVNNPGYARFDMAASYNLTHRLALTARVWNLFDKQYQDAYGYPSLGRAYTFGVRYAFTGPK